MYAQIRDDVMEVYLNFRDPTIPEVLQAAFMMNYVGGMVFPVLKIYDESPGRKMVKLDLSDVFIYAFDQRIEELDIEIELVSFSPDCSICRMD